jgi:hypothetical protein
MAGRRWVNLCREDKEPAMLTNELLNLYNDNTSLIVTHPPKKSDAMTPPGNRASDLPSSIFFQKASLLL